MIRIMLLLLCLNATLVQAVETEEEARIRILKEYGNPEKEKQLLDAYIIDALKTSQAQLDSLSEQFYTPEMIETQSEGVLLISEVEKDYLGEERSQELIEKRKIQRAEFLATIKSRKKTQVIETAVEELPAQIEESTAEITPEQAKSKINDLYKGAGDLKSSFFTKFMDDKMKGELEKLMKSNPMSKMPKEQVEERLDGVFKEGSTMNKLLTSNPKIKKLLVEFFHDENAIGGFISILNKPEVLKKYGICVVVVFVLAFILNLLNSKASFFKRVFIKLGISIGSVFLNLGIFYYLFQKELAPTVDVLRRVF